MKNNLKRIAMTAKVRKLLKTIIVTFSLILMTNAIGAASAFAVDYVSLATLHNSLVYPYDVTESADGKIYVVRGITSKAIVVYNGNYGFHKIISTIANPLAVASSPSGDIYVADNSSKTV